MSRFSTLIEEHSYRWDKAWLRPFESPRSAINNFRGMNCFESDIWVRKLLVGGSNNEFINPSYSNYEHNVLTQSSYENVCKVLGAEDELLSKIADPEYLLDTGFCYCPDCLKEDGYHSSFFSITGVERCPVHGTELINVILTPDVLKELIAEMPHPLFRKEHDYSVISSLVKEYIPGGVHKIYAVSGVGGYPFKGIDPSREKSTYIAELDTKHGFDPDDYFETSLKHYMSFMKQPEIIENMPEFDLDTFKLMLRRVYVKGDIRHANSLDRLIPVADILFKTPVQELKHSEIIYNYRETKNITSPFFYAAFGDVFCASGLNESFGSLITSGKYSNYLRRGCEKLWFPLAYDDIRLDNIFDEKGWRSKVACINTEIRHIMQNDRFHYLHGRFCEEARKLDSPDMPLIGITDILSRMPYTAYYIYHYEDGHIEIRRFVKEEE